MSDTRNPRLVVKGDRFIPKGLKHTEVVRSISVVVHASNGVDYVYDDGEEIRIAPDEELAPSEIELQEALQRESENRAREEAWLDHQRELAEAEAERTKQRELEALRAAAEGDSSEDAAPTEG